MGGRIELIIGPMFAGKSTELLRRVRRHEIAKKKCILLKHSIDTRYNEQMITTHDRTSQMAVPTDKLMAAKHLIDEYHVIGIDEGQFFPDLLEFSEFAANHNKVVIVAALDGTFERKIFGDVCQLIPRAEKVTKLLAVCAQCQQDAAFSKRLTQETSTVCVGGSEKYIAVCRECYFDKVPTPSPSKSTATKKITTTTNSNTTNSSSSSTDNAPSSPTTPLFVHSSPQMNMLSPSS